MKKESFVRISSLLWADILVAYALFIMQKYLTGVWKLSLTYAAAILNFWNGIYRILPLFFLYLVDSFLGNFKLLVFTSISYSVGIVLVFLSAPPVLAESTHTCKDYKPQCIGHTQEILLYAGLVFIAVGVAGNLVSVKPFLEEQRDKKAPKSGPRGDVYQLVGLFGVVVVGIAGAVALPYIKPWTLRFGIPAICTVLGTVWFLSGSCNYNKEEPKGSPLCNVVRVFVAASLKMFRSYPDDNRGYYKINETRFSKTSCLRALHKAAIILPREKVEEGERNRWKLCTVAEVEDAKVTVRMVPMWMTFVACGIVSSAGDTYFVEQAGKLNRNIGKLKLPIQILLLVRRSTKQYIDSKIEDLLKSIGCDGAPSFGIGLGMICSILCCISAAGTERMRLKVVGRHNLLDKADADVPMSMYWLLFQFVLLGGLDSFMENSMNAYYRDQSPESMKGKTENNTDRSLESMKGKIENNTDQSLDSMKGKTENNVDQSPTPIEGYLENFTRGVSGLGFMSSALSVYVVGRISEKGGRPNWFQETLNKSRLDRYYWLLAALSSVNFFVFVFVASRYRYKKPEERRRLVDASGNYTDGYVENQENNSCFGCL